MRMLVLVALLLTACHDEEPTMPDAPPAYDADVDAPVCSGLSSQQSHAVEVGACCNQYAAITCANGAGVCLESVCVRQCSGHYPPCPDGETETWGTWPDGSAQCTCR